MKQATKLIILSVLGLLPTVLMAAWGVPPMINYQGRLTSPGGEPLDTTVSMTFSLYRDSTGGIPISTKVIDSVVVKNGLFQASFCDTICIDSCSPFPSCYKYLAITVGGDSEIEPRTRITSVPYAFHAAWVDGFKSSPNNVNSGLYTVIAGDSNAVLNDYCSILGGFENLINIINEGDTTLDTTDASPFGTSFYSDHGDRQLPWGAFIGGGKKNQVFGNFALVTGGRRNTAHCPFSAIVGGLKNEAGGKFAFIGGGRRNIIGGSNCLCGKASVINGGMLNTINGLYSVIGGGLNNQVLNCSKFGTIGGGHGNTTTGDNSTIGGGQDNTAHGVASTVGGGENSHADFDYSTVAGGRCIDIQSNYGTVGGGYENYIYGEYGTVGGGHGNYAYGIQSTVGGGFSNFANGDSSVVSGGGNNTADGKWSAIGGGIDNTATVRSSTVGGGFSNDAISGGSTIGGGEQNTASGMVSTVGGGWDNTASGDTSVVSGGWSNLASGESSTIPGGGLNIAQGSYSFAAGRQAEALDHGCFVWADRSVYSPFASTGDNQFLIRAAGGVGIGTPSPNANYALHVEGKNKGIYAVATQGTSGARPYAITASLNTTNSVVTGGGLLVSINKQTQAPNISYIMGGDYTLTKGTASGTMIGVRILMIDEASSDYGIQLQVEDPAYAIYSLNDGRVYFEGDVGIGTNNPTAKLDVNGSTGYNQIRMRTSYTPTGSGDGNGNVGDMAWDDNFIYIKTSAGVWKRSPLTTF